MRNLRTIVPLIFLTALFPVIAPAQQEQGWEVKALNEVIPGAPEGRVEYDMTSGVARGTNVFVKYGNATLMANSATLNWQTGEAVADGNVRIESGDQIWVGEHIRYNFKTHQMQSEQFRMGKPPVFAAGNDLQGDISNKTYTARHILVTTDDVSKPAIYARASSMKIVPGKYVEMWNAVLFMDGVPAFYFPYYHRNLGEHANNLNFLAGDSGAYGPFLLNTYDWYLNDTLDGKIASGLPRKPRCGGGTGFEPAPESLGGSQIQILLSARP